MKYLKKFRIFENLTIPNFNDELKSAVENGEITSVYGFMESLFEKLFQSLKSAGFQLTTNESDNEKSITAKDYTFEIILSIDRSFPNSVRVKYLDDDPNDPDKKIIELNPENGEENYGSDGSFADFEFNESGGVSRESDSFGYDYEKYEEDSFEIEEWNDKILERLLKNIEMIKK
jgi:hypothetical protein